MIRVLSFSHTHKLPVWTCAVREMTLMFQFTNDTRHDSKPAKICKSAGMFPGRTEAMHNVDIHFLNTIVQHDPEIEMHMREKGIPVLPTVGRTVTVSGTCSDKAHHSCKHIADSYLKP